MSIVRYWSSLLARDGQLTKHVRNLPLYLAILAIVAVTFVMQNKSVGFESGHHGWVSAHGLAIMSKASFDNHFVGYTLAFKDSNNQPEYYYFDRFPVFFTALFNVVLSFGDNLAAKVYAARQAMNCIFLGTLIAAFLLVRKLVGNKYLALGVVLICFSNFYFLYYKDMVHFDQPALLGFMLLLFAISVYKLDGKRGLLYPAALIALGSGSSYPSFAIIIPWVGLEFITLMRASSLRLGEALRKIVKHDSFIILVIGLVWASSLLAYNIVVEANRTGVPLAQTSIVQSALRRTSLDSEFNEERADDLNWEHFIPGQIERVVYFSIPLGQDQIRSFQYLVWLPLLILVPLFIWKAEPSKRIILLLMALSGFAWLFPMRNLAAFHDYTAMYYLGLPLVFYTGLLSPLRRFEKASLGLLVACLALYVISNSAVSQFHSIRAKTVNDYTYDFERIAQAMDGEGKNIFIQGGYQNLIPGVPYALGFYLPKDYIAPLEVADYVISKNKAYQPNTLTPSNKKVFLFARQTAQRN